MSLRPPLIELTRALASGRFPNTHAYQYDFVMDFNLHYLGQEENKDSRDYAQARMHLMHPTEPSYKGVEQYFCKRFAGRTAEEAKRLLPVHEQALRTIRGCLEDAQRLAKSTGNTETEAWFQEVRNTLFGTFRRV